MIKVKTEDPSAHRPRFWPMLLSAALGVISVALLAAYAGFRAAAPEPAGTIGYQFGDVEMWTTATGGEAVKPAGWSARALAVAVRDPALGAEQFPSPDGRAIAFVTNSDDGAGPVSKLLVKEAGEVIELDQLSGAGSPRLLLADKGGARSAGGVPLLVQWSPDGRTLAWGSVLDPPYTLYMADRNRWDVRALPLIGGYVGELAWSPDDRYLAISTYGENRSDHTLLVMDAAEGVAPPRLAKGCVMVWSPDSQYLALHGEPTTQPGLWVVSVEGDARQIIDHVGVAPFAWVADQR